MGFGVESRSKRNAPGNGPRFERFDSMNPTKQETLDAADPKAAKPAGQNTLSVTDNRTGKKYEIPIKNDTIRAHGPAADQGGRRRFRDDGLRPGVHEHRVVHQQDQLTSTATQAFFATAATRSKSWRRTARTSRRRTCCCTASCRTASSLQDWTYHITHHTFIHESIKKFLDGFHYDAHPMGMMISTVAALSTFYPDAKDIFNAESRQKQTYRLIGKMPTLAAFAYRHSLGMPFVYPDNELSYCGNFLNMLYPDGGAEVPPESDAGARAGCAVHSARGSRAELLFDGNARGGQLACGSILRDGGGDRGALRPASWRRERSRAAHAGGDRIDQQYSRVHQKREGGRKTADGLRPPRLQELRSSRAHREADRLRSLRRDGQAIR